MPQTKKDHVISSEEKQAAVLQIKEMQKQIDYDTKDFTIELLIEKFKRKDFFIPTYQRKFIWQSENKSLFLESIFLGLPIPFMFFADCDNGKQEVIDGAQRMQTLVEFYNNQLQLNGLKKLTNLNGFYFKDVPDAQQRKFLNKTLRIIVLEEDTPTASRQDLFYRINTSGIKANPSEIRRGSYPGPFTNFIEKCANDKTFIELCPMSENKVKRHERFEFVLRFFAYLNCYKEFGHRVDEFLDEYLINNLVDFDKALFYKEFHNMLVFVKENFPHGFAKTEKARSTPRVRFEAISVGVALALRENPDLKINNVNWLDSKAFEDYTTSDGSNNEGRLKLRIEYVKNQLLKG